MGTRAARMGWRPRSVALLLAASALSITALPTWDKHQEVYGCMDSFAENYDAKATFQGPSTVCSFPGCTDPAAANYDPLATRDDGSCTPFQLRNPYVQKWSDRPMAGLSPTETTANDFGGAAEKEARDSPKAAASGTMVKNPGAGPQTSLNRHNLFASNAQPLGAESPKMPALDGCQLGGSYDRYSGCGQDPRWGKHIFQSDFNLGPCDVASKSACYETQNFPQSDVMKKKVTTKTDKTSFMDTMVEAHGEGWGVTASICVKTATEQSMSKTSVDFVISDYQSQNVLIAKMLSTLELDPDLSDCIAKESDPKKCPLPPYHYIAEMFYGASFFAHSTFDVEDTASKSDLHVAASISAGDFFGGKASVDTAKSEMSSNVKYTTKTQVQGGIKATDDKLNIAQQHTAWSPTVDDDTAIPLSVLLEPYSNVRPFMKALNDRVAKTPSTEWKAVLSYYQGKQEVPPDFFTMLRKEYDELTKVNKRVTSILDDAAKLSLYDSTQISDFQAIHKEVFNAKDYMSNINGKSRFQAWKHSTAFSRGDAKACATTSPMDWKAAGDAMNELTLRQQFSSSCADGATGCQCVLGKAKEWDDQLTNIEDKVQIPTRGTLRVCISHVAQYRERYDGGGVEFYAELHLSEPGSSWDDDDWIQSLHTGREWKSSKIDCPNDSYNPACYWCFSPASFDVAGDGETCPTGEYIQVNDAVLQKAEKKRRETNTNPWENLDSCAEVTVSTTDTINFRLWEYDPRDDDDFSGYGSAPSTESFYKNIFSFGCATFTRVELGLSQCCPGEWDDNNCDGDDDYDQGPQACGHLFAWMSYCAPL